MSLFNLHCWVLETEKDQVVKVINANYLRVYENRLKNWNFTLIVHFFM